MEQVQLCQCERPIRVRNVICVTMVRYWVCRHELLYRLKSVGGECKMDAHLWSRLSDVYDGWYCRDAGFPLVVRWSGMLHGLRGIKGSMYLLGSWRCEHVLYIIPSLCEGVLMDQGI